MSANKTVKLERDYYIHILNHLTQLTRVVTGPVTFIRKDYEEIVDGPSKNTQLPPNAYVIISNPVIMNEDGSPQTDQYKCYKLQYGETEVRTSEKYPDSFPLYPGEKLVTPTPLPYKVVTKDQAILIYVNRDYVKSDKKMLAGTYYQENGPMTYIPRKEEDFVETKNKTVIKANTALRLQAKNDFTDRDGVERKNGEEWYYNKVGSFWSGIYEDILRVEKGVI